MRCGLHYVRFCDLRIKQCAGAPGNQAATKSIADALAGGPLIRRKVHAFAKHPSGSRPGAPGARLPSDVLFFDPSVPRPPGPAIPQAQGGAPESPGGATQEQGPQGDHQSAESHVPAGERGLLAPRVEHEPRAALRAHAPQGEAPSGPELEEVGLLPGSPGVTDRPEEGKAAPTEAKGIRAFLGLRPSQVPPGARQKITKTSKAGEPARAKAKRIPRGSAGRQSPGAQSQEGPSGNPACHIHHWLRRMGVASAGTTACTHGTPGSSNDPPPKARPADGGAALGTRVVTVCAPGPPGSSTDPPPRWAVTLAREGRLFWSRTVRAVAPAFRVGPGGSLGRAAVGARIPRMVGGGP